MTTQVLVDNHHGIYIPQIFAERYGEYLTDEQREILLAGPDHESYLDVACEIDGMQLEEDEFVFSGPCGDLLAGTQADFKAACDYEAGEFDNE